MVPRQSVVSGVFKGAPKLQSLSLRLNAVLKKGQMSDVESPDRLQARQRFPKKKETRTKLQICIDCSATVVSLHLGRTLRYKNCEPEK